MKHILMAFILALLSVAAAPADDVRPKLMTLHVPVPAQRALQYALLPELRDTIPGNAADHYRQAIKNLERDVQLEGNWYLAFDKWMAAPLKELPQEEVGKFLKPRESALKEVEAGARSEQCDWGVTEDIRKNGLKGLNSAYHDFTGLRKIAALLTLRVRYELAQGRTGQAVRTLQIGFAMARHYSDSSTFITALFGMAIVNLMLERLEELLQQPNAPNLYWPLTDLPRPFIDLRRPLQGEHVFAYGNFPGMTEAASDLHAKPWTPEQVETSVAFFRQIDKGSSLLGEKSEAEKLLRLAAKQEGIKKILMDQGRPKEIVDAMPDEQVALLLALQQYDVMFDEFLKWQSLPFWESYPAMVKLEEQQKKRQNDKDGPTVALTHLLDPSMTKAVAAQVRIDRRIAALRCVEAVRLYAGAHDGKLPPSLEEIKDAPLPLDPVTGKAFDYHVGGERAFLTSTPFPGLPADNANTPTYELTIQR
jgi:hypothetical protein